MSVKEVIANCDAVLWISAVIENEIRTSMTFFRSAKDCSVLPTETGFKYNILVFRNAEDAEEGSFEAIIGDVQGYAERLGKLGYHGIMFKKNVKPRRELKHLFETILGTFGFTKKQIKKVLKTTLY